MSRSGALTFGDIEGKLEYLVLECRKCPRRGRYSVARLIAEHGRSGKMTDWSHEVTKDCPRAIAKDYTDWCDVHTPGLAKVA